MKKYIVISAVALTSLISCVKLETSVQRDEEIFFTVVNSLQQTKADDADTHGHLAYYPSGHFGTYAWYNAANGGTQGQTLMSNQEVTASSSTWKPVGKVYYWPKTGSADFVSYSPYLAEGSGVPTVSVDYANKKLSISNWVVNTAKHTNSYSDDLMYSEWALDQTENTTTHFTSGVPTLFHHALAKLNFEIAFDMTNLKDSQKALFDGVKVTSLKIFNIKYKGSFESKTPKWILTDDMVAYASPVTLSSTATTTKAQTTGYVADYFIIPQEISGTENIEIEYYILPDTTTKLTAKISMKTDSITAWEINKSYTYVISIAPVSSTPIKFVPTVSDWTGVNGGGIDLEVAE